MAVAACEGSRSRWSRPGRDGAVGANALKCSPMRVFRRWAASLLLASLVSLSIPADEPAPVPGSASAPSGAAAEPATESAAPADPRPLVRLIVRNEFRPEDQLFPQLVEGRLVADLADMETFRTAGPSAKDADYVLTCIIKSLVYNASTVYNTSRDADSTGGAQATDTALLTMDMAFTLQDAEGKTVHDGKLSVDASHEIEKSSEYTATVLKQEMIDRTAQRLERIIRKKLKKK